MTTKELQKLVEELQNKVKALEEENRKLKASRQANRRTFLVNIPLWTKIVENAPDIVSVGNDAQKCYLTHRKPAKFVSIRLTVDMVANKQLRQVIQEFINNGKNSQNNGNNGTQSSSNGQTQQDKEIFDDDDDIF